MIVGKKTLQKMGENINENVSAKPSNFSMMMMKKMGWVEGEGLGKNNDGIKTHISITKREEKTGLGLDKDVC